MKKNDSSVETGFPNQIGSVVSGVCTEKILETARGYKRLGLFNEARADCAAIPEDDLSREDAQFLLIGLDLGGLAVSSGSACLVGSVQPSHVLAAMGVPAEWASATVRFSIGPQIRDEDGVEIARRVRQVVNHQRALRGWTPDPILEQTRRQELVV